MKFFIWTKLITIYQTMPTFVRHGSKWVVLNIFHSFAKQQVSQRIFFWKNIENNHFFLKEIISPFTTYGPSSKTMETIHWTGDAQFDLNWHYFFFRKNQKWVKYLQVLCCIISRQNYFLQSHLSAHKTNYLVVLHVKCCHLPLIQF